MRCEILKEPSTNPLIVHERSKNLPVSWTAWSMTHSSPFFGNTAKSFIDLNNYFISYRTTFVYFNKRIVNSQTLWPFSIDTWLSISQCVTFCIEIIENQNDKYICEWRTSSYLFIVYTNCTALLVESPAELRFPGLWVIIITIVFRLVIDYWPVVDMFKILREVPLLTVGNLEDNR